EPPGDAAELAPEVLDQAGPLGRHRGADLGRLGDPFDELLRLIACQEPLPEAIEELAVQPTRERSLGGWSPESSGHGVLELRPLQDAHQRSLERRALGRAYDRLLGGRLGGTVQAGKPGHSPRAAGSGSHHARRKRSLGYVLTHRSGPLDENPRAWVR